MSFRIKLSQHNVNLIWKTQKKQNFQYANFEKFPILGPDLAMENDIV